MAIYKSDRERRILGDRIVARQASFDAVHDAIGAVHEKFVAVHNATTKAINAREKERSEDERARAVRDENAAQVANLYQWAFHQIDTMLAPAWDDIQDDTETNLLKSSLFPLGTPSDVQDSVQLITDGMTQFLAAVDDQTSVTFPPPFLARCASALANLRGSIDTVTKERGESTAVTQDHAKARAAWDRVFAALREITGGFLKLAGRQGELAGLFKNLPSSSKGTDVATVAEGPKPEPVTTS